MMSSSSLSPPDSPVVLQVLPSLVTGGVERGTVEIAQAIAEAEATALVASAGGPLVRQIERAGGIHITLPLTTKSPVGIWRNAASLETLIRDHQVSLVHARSRAPAWSAWLACQRTRGAVRDDLSRHLWRRIAGQTFLQRRHGARADRHRRQPVHRRPGGGAARGRSRPHPGDPPRRRSGGVRSGLGRRPPDRQNGGRRGGCPTAFARWCCRDA